MSLSSILKSCSLRTLTASCWLLLDFYSSICWSWWSNSRQQSYHTLCPNHNLVHFLSFHLFIPLHVHGGSLNDFIAVIFYAVWLYCTFLAYIVSFWALAGRFVLACMQYWLLVILTLQSDGFSLSLLPNPETVYFVAVANVLKMNLTLRTLTNAIKIWKKVV